MKKLILSTIVLAVGLLAFAQSTTNNLSIVLDVGQDNVLHAAHNYDNQLRTNGLPPYTNVVAQQNFKTFCEGIGSVAFVEKVNAITQQREAEMLALWRAATVQKQNQALRTLQ